MSGQRDEPLSEFERRCYLGAAIAGGACMAWAPCALLLRHPSLLAVAGAAGATGLALVIAAVVAGWTRR